jgi:hypothetical protein
LDPLDVRKETVATFRDGLDEAGSGRGIPERAANLGDRGVQARVEFDERVVGPQELPQLLARDQLTRPGYQEAEYAGRLLLQGHATAVAVQNPRIEIELERSEARDTTGVDYDHR